MKIGKLMPPNSEEPLWLTVAREMQALAQNGLTFTENPYDVERYEALQVAAAKLLAHGFSIEPKEVHDAVGELRGYVTPQVDVRGAIFRGETVLLVQEKSDQRWTMPGGFADVNISPAENVVKEISEEAGVEAKATKLIGVYDRRRHVPVGEEKFRHIYKLFFQCEIISGEPTPGMETQGADFFPIHELPPLSVGRIAEGQIHDAFAHFQDPTRMPHFE